MIELKKLVVTVREKEIELTLEECISLKTILDRVLYDDEINRAVRYALPYYFSYTLKNDDPYLSGHCVDMPGNYVVHKTTAGLPNNGPPVQGAVTTYKG